MLPQKKTHEREQGSVAAEFVIILPVFIFIFFAIVEFGNFMAIKNNLTSAAREGARIGVLPGAEESDVTDKITNTLAEWKINAADVVMTIDTPYSDIGPGATFTITLVMDYEKFGLAPQIFSSFFPDAVGKATMRKEMINSST